MSASMHTGRAWPIGITAILAATVAANLWVMRVATADPSFAIEPDYYRKAVHYDATMAQARANLQLGWVVTAQLAPLRAGHATTLTVALHDAHAVPLTGARVAIMARHNARANDTLTAVLREGQPGAYTAVLPVSRPGEWEVRVDATRGRATYSASTRITAISSRRP